MSPALDGGAEDGSAVVEFVLVSVLVVVLLLALVQVGLALHIRNTLLLEEMDISEPCLAQMNGGVRYEVLGAAHDLAFGQDGNLPGSNGAHH